MIKAHQNTTRKRLLSEESYSVWNCNFTLFTITIHLRIFNLLHGVRITGNGDINNKEITVIFTDIMLLFYHGMVYLVTGIRNNYTTSKIYTNHHGN